MKFEYNILYIAEKRKRYTLCRQPLRATHIEVSLASIGFGGCVPLMESSARFQYGWEVMVDGLLVIMPHKTLYGLVSTLAT